MNLHFEEHYVLSKLDFWAIVNVCVSRGCVSIMCISRFKHYSYLRIFSLKKRLISRVFFPKFSQIGIHFWGFFLPQKWLILQFSRNFCEIGPSWNSKDVFDQNVTHFWGFFYLKMADFTIFSEIFAPKSDRLAYE